jgi:GNAT superfamily N-acetyltransferase
MHWRDEPRESDRQAVRRLVAATCFFSREEQDIAVELVDEALTQGKASGYEFIFLDGDAAPHDLRGYTCFGPIPSRPGSYDLYWIAVAPRHQRHGTGRRLLEETERRALAQGATDMFIDTSGREQYRPTRSFYERMGYRAQEIIPDFYASGDDKVVYRKQLRAGPVSGQCNGKLHAQQEQSRENGTQHCTASPAQDALHMVEAREQRRDRQ